MEIVETPLNDKARFLSPDNPSHVLTWVVFANDVREGLPFSFVGTYRFERGRGG